MAYLPPAPPYVGPPRWSGGATNKPIRRLVVHCTAGLEPHVEGAARSTANYTKNTSRPSSWHYCRDSREAVQLTFDSFVAYHDGTNDHSLAYELCCSLSNQGGIIRKATATVKALTHWQLPSHRRMLRGAAKDFAELCLAYDIPVRRIRAKAIRAGEYGICGHNDMRLAFPGSTTHWDPGPYFPWRRFMRLIRAEVAALTAEVEEEAAPKGPTRVTRFRDECEALVAKYLDPAVDGGRKGRVKKVRDNIRAELARLPRR